MPELPQNLAGPFGRRSPAVFAGAARCLARTQETFVVTASHQSGKFGGTDLIVAIRVDFLHHLWDTRGNVFLRMGGRVKL